MEPIELAGPVEASLNTGKVLEHFRGNNLPIAHIQHVSADPEAMPIFVGGTYGVEIHENVKPLEGETISEILPKQF